MRMAALLLLGLLLELLAGTLGQVWRLEWFRPDPLLALVVLCSLDSGAAGLVAAFLLGVMADWVGAGVGGVSVLGYLLVWLVLYSGRSWLWPEMVLVRALLVAGAGLIAMLAGLLYLLLVGAPPELVKFQLSVMPLLLLVESLLGLGVWWLAVKLWRPGPRPAES